MSKKILILACLLALCLAGSASAANLFENPGFEETNHFYGWTVTQLGTGKVNPSSVYHHTGSYSMNLSAAYPTGTAKIAQTIDLTGVNNISLQVYKRVIGGSAAFQIYINSTQVYSSSYSNTGFEVVNINTKGYTGSKQITIQSVTTGGACLAYVDDISALYTDTTASLNWTAPSYSAGQTATINWAISGYNASRSYRIDITNDEAGLLDRDYISGSSGIYQTVIPELDPFIGIAYLDATIYETSPTLTELGSDEAIYIESDNPTIAITGTGYVGSTATISYVQAPTGSWIRLIDDTTSTELQVWTGLYGNGLETYTVASTAYGHTYEATLYSSSGTALDSATLTIQGTATNNSSMYTLSGKVYDSETGSIIYPATISADGRTAQSNNVGAYSLLMSPGVTSTTCSATGYVSKTLDISMTLDNTLDWYLTPENPTTTGNASVVGTVIDPSTGLPVSGATVTVTDENGNTKTVTTSDTGYYEIDGLEDGSYTITIAKEGYDTVTETVDVDGETTHDSNLVDEDATDDTTTPSSSSGDSNGDGIDDSLEDTDGDGIPDSEDTSSSRPGRVAAAGTMAELENLVPSLITIAFLFLFLNMIRK